MLNLPPLEYSDSQKLSDFNYVVAPLIDCLKAESFKWTGEVEQAFQQLKRKVTKAPVLSIPYFLQPFEVHCDASELGVGGVLSHSCEKPNEDHEVLKYISGRHKLNARHAKWVEFLQSYTFVI